MKNTFTRRTGIPLRLSSSVRHDLQSCRPSRLGRLAAAMPLHDSRCHIASRLQLCLAGGESLLGINSVRSAGELCPATLCIARGRWGNWPDIKILVSGMYPEIVHTRLSVADCAIRVAHKSGLEGRHVRAQILKRSDCQSLEHFLSAHVFALNMIQSRYDLQSGIFRTYIPADCKSRRYALRPPERHLTIPLPHSLAAAIAPRRQEKSARRQFSPLGKVSCVIEPDADCGRGRLVPRFRLASRSAASGHSRQQFCNPPSRANPIPAHRMVYLPARWKEKVPTSNYERPHRGFRQRLI